MCFESMASHVLWIHGELCIVNPWRVMCCGSMGPLMFCGSMVSYVLWIHGESCVVDPWGHSSVVDP